jgi:NCS1 family nucleobase:cation symporter-1
MAGSSLLSLGLTIPHTVGIMIIARVIMAVLVIGNGWMGAEWHVGFTVSQRFVSLHFHLYKHFEFVNLSSGHLRMVLGMNGAYIGQIIRIILSIIWYGSQAWLGGLCVSAMLSSWSYDFLTMPNTLPESAHMVTRDFVGFCIFQAISIPVLVSALLQWKCTVR